MKTLHRHFLHATGFILLATMVSIGVVSTSCSGSQPADEESGKSSSPKVEALRKDVITVHDEVMPLMTNIYKLKSSLKAQLDSGKNVSPERSQAINAAITELDNAAKGMRVWMRDFSKVNTDALSEEEATKVLEKEMEEIKKVKDDMIKSVEVAKGISSTESN